MAKKNIAAEVAAPTQEPVQPTVPTPIAPEDLMCAPGYKVVKELDYTKLIDLCEKLIGQKKELHEQNQAYKTDLRTIVECLVQLQPLVGSGGFSPAAIMNLMKNKDKLAAGLKPMFEVIEKYTTTAQVEQLSA